MGDTVNISVDVQRILETMLDIHFLAFTPRGGAGIALKLTQHLSVVGHAIVTIAARGLPQGVVQLPFSRARVDGPPSVHRRGHHPKLTRGPALRDHRQPGETSQARAPGNKDLRAVPASASTDGISPAYECLAAHPGAALALPLLPHVHRWSTPTSSAPHPSTLAYAASTRAGKGEYLQWSRNGRCRSGDECV